MKPLMRVALMLVVLLVLGSCVTTQGDLFETVVASDSDEDERSGAATANGEKDGTEDDAEDETTDSAKDPAPEGIYLKTEPERVSVYLDGKYVGKTPLLLEVKEGSYEISLSRIGYYPRTFEVSYQEGENQIYDVVLKQITGYLHVDVDQPGARITVDGTTVSPGVTELPVGSYGVTIRAFGFETYRTNVTVRERSTTEIDATLVPAPLRIEGLSLSRPVLNPANPGRLGEVGISFDVSTYAIGTALIADQSGRIVKSLPLDRFTTWEQRVVWDGTNNDGSAVDDGVYLVSIDATADSGTRVTTSAAPIEVSRRAVISYRVGWTGVAGMLYVPTAEMLPSGSFQLTTAAAGTVSGSSVRAPVQLYLRVPASSRFEIGVQGGLIINSSGNTPFSAGVSVTYDLLGASDATAPVALAAYGIGTYLARTSADTQTNYSGGRAGIAGTLRAGPARLSGAVELALAPYPVTYGPDLPTYEPTMFGYGRLGLLLDFGGLSIGASSAVRSTPFFSGLAVELPFVAGAEAHWLVPGTFVTLSAISVLEFESVENYYIAIGGGIGIIH